MDIRLVVSIFVGIFSFSGCGDTHGNPSATIINESTKPFFVATIQWEIAKDIEDKKLEELENSPCGDSGRCTVAYKMPKKIEEMLLRFAGAALQSHPHSSLIASNPRPLDSSGVENKFVIYEIVHLIDNCTDVSVVVVYKDNSEGGMGWLKRVHSATIRGDTLERDNASSEIDALSKYPRVSFHLVRCPKDAGKNAENVQINYNK